MPIFISYSHSDKKIVDKLAAHLVKNNAHVWIDRWELNVGDSIISKVQEAIQGSSALLVMLSKASVQSEWCKKELNAGFMRELDEKRVVVLPVMIEDCVIPIFLREKMYADLRIDFKAGLNSILNAIAKITNSDQGRIYQDNGYSDWAVDWGYRDDLFELRFTIIQTYKDLGFTLLTEVFLLCNENVTRRYQQYVNADLAWLGRAMLTESLFDLGDKKDFRLLLEDQFPKEIKAEIHDSKSSAEYEVLIRSRRLGEDNGKDQLVNISNYLKDIRDYMRHVSRKPTAEETMRLMEIIKTPFGA